MTPEEEKERKHQEDSKGLTVPTVEPVSQSATGEGSLTKVPCGSSSTTDAPLAPLEKKDSVVCRLCTSVHADMIKKLEEVLQVKLKTPAVCDLANHKKIEEVEMTKKVFTKSVTFSKKDPAKKIVYGVVYEPDTVDAQGDFATEDEIEKACHGFMELHQQLSVEHGEVNKELKLVENYIAPVEMTLGDQKVKKGSWIQAIKVNNDEIWKKVESGEITGLSMEGAAERVAQTT